MSRRLGAFTFALLASAAFGGDDLAPSGKWSAYTAGHAATPPMGWSSWNTFATNISEERVLGVGEALVKTGLAAKGYRYVNMDDGWWLKRRQPDGRMLIRTEQFPSAATGKANHSSFKPFTDKLHKMGLKAGIYSDLGRNSCSQAYPAPDGYLPKGTMEEREIGLYGHADQDIKLYMQEWGFDYIKVDACGIRAYFPSAPQVKSGEYRTLDPLILGWQLNGTKPDAVKKLYSEVSDALIKYKPNNDFLFSICVWGAADVRSWAKDVGNISRTSDDLGPIWTRMLHNFDSASRRALYAHPGSWNDPDMLYIGYGEFDEHHLTEARSHFALWAITNAPLILGNDIRAMAKPLHEIVSNADIIAINQDPAGNQATLAYDADNVQIFVKTLANGKKAVAIFNRGMGAAEVDLTAQQMKLADDADIVLTDLWTKEQTKIKKEAKFTVAPRQTLIFTAEGPHRLANGLYLSEMPGRVNPAADGVTIAEPDPYVYRFQTWGSTRGNGAHPQYAGWGGAMADFTPYGQSLRIGGKDFDSGIGVLANSRLEVRNDGATTFTAEVGVDDSTRDTKRAVTFSVYGDGKLLKQSASKALGDKPEMLNVPVKGVKIIELVASAPAGQVPAVITWGNAALTK
jgi:hypothetical protein